METVKNVDQLLQLLYPEYSLLQHCLRKKSPGVSSAVPSLPDSSASAFHSTDDDLWVILEEIQRTSCQPREVCVEVTKEYPESTSSFYVPRCVSLHRCGGCCSNEALYCTNTSYALVSKTLIDVSPSRTDRSVVMVTFINHTSCECFFKQPPHSIIRRATTEQIGAPNLNLPCASGSLWDPVNCVCVSADPISYSQTSKLYADVLDSGLLALCGPNRVLDESTCECVCQNGLTEDSCGPGWKLDHKTCECQCEGQGDGRFCPAGQRWDVELCGCVCAAQCPRDQPLNPDTCTCQCRESPQSCLRQGKKFNHNTCSCYKLPCRKPRPACPTDFYYSPQVCQCIPNYMRPGVE
uniref:Platelet-derived growth factor (PDGF) family profile domain-containing protein n=1 Tax=Tetraodon nigroviridis TaxID=99883 RepID=H3C5W6_TETNG